ncbi:MAG: hypothetical protein IT210_20935 [Armatimonadetes bacterium]|nr:hypothetical protein [Armatimonadota bacterium]
MRGKIRLETTIGRVQEGVLVPEEEKLVWVHWNHAAPLEFAGLAPFEPSRIPAPRWGHALNAAWLDKQGRILDRAQNVFAVEEGGYAGLERKFGMNDALAARPLSEREAFELRYSGYPGLWPFSGMR